MISIKEKIEEWAKKTLGEGQFNLVHPKEIKNGDFTLIVATEYANEFGEVLSKNLIPEVEKVEVACRFVNLFLSKEFFVESVNEINEKATDFGKTNLLEDQKIMVEYTDPNPFKEFHIGHLMPNVIGESLSRLFEASNAEVKRVNYQGDVGMHVAKAVWGKLQKPESSWGDAYVYGSQNYDDNKTEVEKINKKIYEKSDQKINNLYEEGKKQSLDYFEMVYKKLGTKFDHYFFESEVGGFGKEIVLEFLKKGVFEKSDGAVVFHGEKYDPKLHTRVFINSQGLPVYEAKELGLSKIKYNAYPYDLSVVVTGNEINEYFKVLLAAMGQIFPELAQKTKHISHGMLRLPTGKMSSRTGNIITADSLIEQVKEKIKEKIDDNSIAEIIAIGAIKYSILRQAIGGDIIFDFDKSISFEGDSGPYLQYTAVRAKSVLEKAKNYTTLKVSKVPFDTPIEVERLLYRFPEIGERASRECAPHHIVTYLIELASSFNSFYANNKIIDESDPASPYKLALTQAVAHALTNGLQLLGIKVPEKM